MKTCFLKKKRKAKRKKNGKKSQKSRRQSRGKGKVGEKMIIQVHNRYFGFKEFEISLLERIKLRLKGRIYVFHAKPEGWAGEVPFYIVKCGKCGCYFLDYPHGDEEYFLCPRCDLPKLQSHQT